MEFLGLIDKKPLVPQKVEDGDSLVILGDTKMSLVVLNILNIFTNSLEEFVLQLTFLFKEKHEGPCLDVIKKQLVKIAHDCSKGGLAVAVSEICMTNEIGCKISLG